MFSIVFSFLFLFLGFCPGRGLHRSVGGRGRFSCSSYILPSPDASLPSRRSRHSSARNSPVTRCRSFHRCQKREKRNGWNGLNSGLLLMLLTALFVSLWVQGPQWTIPAGIDPPPPNAGGPVRARPLPFFSFTHIVYTHTSSTHFPCLHPCIRVGTRIAHPPPTRLPTPLPRAPAPTTPASPLWVPRPGSPWVENSTPRLRRRTDRCGSAASLRCTALALLRLRLLIFT